MPSKNSQKPKCPYCGPQAVIDIQDRMSDRTLSRIQAAFEGAESAVTKAELQKQLDKGISEAEKLLAEFRSLRGGLR